jgi:hypothetical protein
LRSRIRPTLSATQAGFAAPSASIVKYVFDEALEQPPGSPPPADGAVEAV